MSKAGKKQFFKFGDKNMGRYFNYNTWRRMTEGEQDLWQEADSKPFPNETVLTRKQEQKNMLESMKRHGIEDLHVKPGQKYNFGNTEVEILQWGANRHLVKSRVRGSSGMCKYGTIPRLTRDSPDGAKDVMRDNLPYSRYRTLDEAKREYRKVNG